MEGKDINVIKRIAGRPGDNRPVFLDSRVMGSVERKDIIGRVFGQSRISVGNK